MALKAGYKGIKEVGPGLDYDNTTGLLKLDGESSLKLDNLEDVTIDTPLGGDVLQYDSSNDEWTNETPDTEPIEDSPQLITSGAVYAGLKTEDDKISAIWSSNARTGVHNLYLLENSDIRDNLSGTHTLADGEITITTNNTNNSGSFLRIGSKLSDYANVPCVLSFKYKSTIACNGVVGIENVTETLPTAWTEKKINVSNPVSIGDVMFYNRDTTQAPVISVKELCIALADDTYPDFTPYAMTNGELTEKVQGIIDAANNAADFAAFKTAIGNL